MLRYFTVYGPRQRPDMALAQFVEGGLLGRRVTVYGDGSQRRFLTYVGDVAKLTALAVVQQFSGLHALDVCGEEAWSVNQMLDAVADLTGREIAVDRVPGRSDDPLHIPGDRGTAQAAFGWKPTTSVQRGLHAQVEWASSQLLSRDSTLAEEGDG
jgi:nucleoside-diphosphate-sugar epimerase